MGQSTIRREMNKEERKAFVNEQVMQIATQITRNPHEGFTVPDLDPEVHLHLQQVGIYLHYGGYAFGIGKNIWRYSPK